MGDIAERLKKYSADKPFQGASQHDAHRVLTPREIIALKKDLLSDDPYLDKISNLAAFIVTGILIDTYKVDARRRLCLGSSYGSNVPQDLEGRIDQAAGLGANWATCISNLCRLPEDEWREGWTPPSSIADWLEQMREMQASTPEQPDITLTINVV